MAEHIFPDKTPVVKLSLPIYELTHFSLLCSVLWYREPPRGCFGILACEKIQTFWKKSQKLLLVLVTYFLESVKLYMGRAYCAHFKNSIRKEGALWGKVRRKAVATVKMNPKPFFCITENVHASPGRSAAGASGFDTVGQNKLLKARNEKWKKEY